LQFDNFKIETASRKVLLELLTYFNERDSENHLIVKSVRALSEDCKEKLGEIQRMNNRMDVQNVDYTALIKRLLKVEHKVDRAIDGKQSMEMEVSNKLLGLEASVETKLLVLGHYDLRMGSLDHEIADVRKLAHA
jgi:acyl carrier protein